MRTVRICSLLVVAFVAACQTAPEAPAGRLALSLTGQFFPGELATLDLFVYDGDEVECTPEDGSLSTRPSTAIDSLTGLSLDSPQEISFELPIDVTYVIAVTAGRGSAGDFDLVAQGCQTVTLARQVEVSLDLHRIESCGDGDTDPQEMCDGDEGCDGSCQTETAWANDALTFRESRQDHPLAASDDDLVALCWHSDYLQSQMGPMAWFNSAGGDGDAFLVQPASWDKLDCTALDVRGDLVMMSYTLGSGEPATRRNMVIAWAGREQMTPISVGARVDPNLVAALYDDEAVAVVNETATGLMLRDLQIAADTLVLGEEVTVVHSESTGQTAPAIAGGDGSFVIAWQDEDEQVWVRLFNGITGGAEAQNLCPAPARCAAPAVASLRDGRDGQYLVVYLESNAQVVGRVIQASGQASDEFPISTETRCREPALAALNAERGEFVVVWTQPVDPGQGEYPSRVFARVVTGVGEYGQLATGSALTGDPLQVTPDNDDTDYDQPSVGTAYGTSDPSTALVFYRDIGGIHASSDWDIGLRLIRVARIPTS